MADSALHTTEHQVKIFAPARVVYELLADIVNWPRVFPPTVHVDREALDDTRERIKIWATVNGEVKGWTSLRELDRKALRLRFRQEVSQPPVASMSGEWVVEALSETETLVRLTHAFTAVGDDEANVAWIHQAIDKNSEAELGALKAFAEGHASGAGPGQLLSFVDEVRVGGAASDVYDFINEADKWPQRLPHVDSVSLEEDVPGVQVLTMDSRTADGSVHKTTSVRIAFPHHRIVYKQLALPPLLNVHTGRWQITADGADVVVQSEHTVVIKTEAIASVLGERATVQDARTFIRQTLGRNSITTMEHAKAYAEGR